VTNLATTPTLLRGIMAPSVDDIKPILGHRLGTAPLLGQGTDRVLPELLGLTAKEIEALHAGGVIEPVKT